MELIVPLISIFLAENPNAFKPQKAGLEGSLRGSDQGNRYRKMGKVLSSGKWQIAAAPIPMRIPTLHVAIEINDTRPIRGLKF